MIIPSGVIALLLMITTCISTTKRSHGHCHFKRQMPIATLLSKNIANRSHMRKMSRSTM